MLVYTPFTVTTFMKIEIIQSYPTVTTLKVLMGKQNVIIVDKTVKQSYSPHMKAFRLHKVSELHS